MKHFTHQTVRPLAVAMLFAVAPAFAAPPADGIPDPAWGNLPSDDGLSFAAFDLGTAKTDFAADSVATSDGLLYVAGTVTDAENRRRFGIARFDQAGIPDTGFNADGLTISLETDVTATSLALGGGSLYVAGYKTISANESRFIVCRFAASTGNVQNFPAPTNAACVSPAFPPVTRAEANDIAIQADGKIVLAGAIDVGATPRAAFARFLANGQPDLDFGPINNSNMQVIRNDAVFTRHDINAVAIASNGKIVGVGSTRRIVGLQVEALMVRLNADGTQDETTAQGEYGFNVPGISGRDTVLNDLTLLDVADADDAIVAVGYAELASENRGGMIVKVNPDGASRDVTFGDTGVGNTTIAIQGDLQYQSVTAHAGGFVVVGDRPGQDALDIEVRRFRKQGSPDLDFGNGSNLVIDYGFAGQTEQGAGVSVQGDAVYFSGTAFRAGVDYDMVAGKLLLDRIFEDDYE